VRGKYDMLQPRCDVTFLYAQAVWRDMPARDAMLWHISRYSFAPAEPPLITYYAMRRQMQRVIISSQRLCVHFQLRLYADEAQLDAARRCAIFSLHAAVMHAEVAYK